MSTSSNQRPGLFGLTNTNRDFTKKDSWGKNQFNNSFPTSLACYMYAQKIAPVYLVTHENTTITHEKIPADALFGIQPLVSNIHFSFEQSYMPFSDLVIGKLPRIDLVIQNTATKYNDCIQALEIKLTALPDNTTCDLPEGQYGSEIVVRPDTIVYLALRFASLYRNHRSRLLDFLAPVCQKISNWQEPLLVRGYIPDMINALEQIIQQNTNKQTPFLMQSVWKTIGKTGGLADNCFDIFVWSDFGLTRLITHETLQVRQVNITRVERTVVWLVKMLYDFAQTGKVDHKKVIDEVSFNVKNDKAFAISGSSSHPYMHSPELLHPRINKYAIRDIIQGNGHKMLSPERRLDAIILNTPGLFAD